MKPNILFLIIDCLRADKFPRKNQNNYSPNFHGQAYLLPNFHSKQVYVLHDSTN